MMSESEAQTRKILLLEAQEFPLGVAVVRIENGGDGLCHRGLTEGVRIVCRR
jgi:hypothetical protein